MYNREFGARGPGNRAFNRYDKGVGKHILGGRRDGVGPHYEEGCNTVVRGNTNYGAYTGRYTGSKTILETKMFMDKKEMVEFANEAGKKGHSVEVFKIEEDLYKAVVYEK